jgi:hypothetical protein
MDLSAIGRQFGLDDAQTKAALEALAPVVAAGVRRNAQTPTGLQDIFKSVLTGGDSSVLGDPDQLSLERAKPRGDDILGQIFGGKEVSRGVANQLSATSGIGAAILKKLLPIVATMVLGKMAKSMTGGASASPGGGGLGDILKDILGGGMGGGMGGGSPSPVPQQRMPQPMPRQVPQTPQGGSSGGLEDILNDILAGGQKGGVVVKQIDPGQMGEILKDIFGGGFPGGAQVPGNTRPQPNEEAVTRGRRTIEDMTGGGTPSGNMADDMLNSVEKAIRRGG